MIPTYRRPARAARLIRALERQTLAADRFDVVLVDDCSAPDAVERLHDEIGATPLALRLEQTRVNGGPAVARNLGWRSSAAPLLAFVDDDCVPEPEWLAAGLAALHAPDRPGVVQGRTRVPDGVDVAALPRWSLWREIPDPGPFYEGCNIFYRREALEAAGGFDEGIAWWGEDTALGWRVVEAGWPSGWAGDAVVVHDVEARGFRWHLEQGWNERNVVALAARHPGYRAGAFWRPWAFRRNDALFALAAAGAAVALRRPVALAATLPYLYAARPSIRREEFVRTGAEIVAVDAARFAGHVVGALRHRILVV